MAVIPWGLAGAVTGGKLALPACSTLLMLVMWRAMGKETRLHVLPR